MADTLKTPAGSLKIGSRYNLTLKHGDIERVLRRAKVISFIHAGIGTYLGRDPKPGEMVPGDIETRYQAETAAEVVGFLPEHVLKADDV